MSKLVDSFKRMPKKGRFNALITLVVSGIVFVTVVATMFGGSEDGGTGENEAMRKKASARVVTPAVQESKRLDAEEYQRNKELYDKFNQERMEQAKKKGESFMTIQPAIPADESLDEQVEQIAQAPENDAVQPEPKRDERPGRVGFMDYAEYVQTKAQMLNASLSNEDKMPEPKFTAEYQRYLARKKKEAEEREKARQEAQAGSTRTASTKKDATEKPASSGDYSKGKRPLLPGDILTGVSLAELNSDSPTSALVEIVTGKLRGARLMGQFQKSGELLVVKMTQMTWRDNTCAIDAVLVDPDTYQTGVATEVNRHTMLKLGSLFVSGLLSGAKELVLNQGDTTIPGSGTVVVTRPRPSAGDIMMVGAGKVGDEVLRRLDKIQSIPTTVKLAPNIMTGVMFMKDTAQGCPWLPDMRKEKFL